MCAIGSKEYEKFKKEIDAPEQLADILDQIFGALPENLVLRFPWQVFSAMPVGADLTNSWKKFIIWTLIDTKFGVLQYVSDLSVVKNVASSYERYLSRDVSTEIWQVLNNVAYEASRNSKPIKVKIVGDTVAERKAHRAAVHLIDMEADLIIDAYATASLAAEAADEASNKYGDGSGGSPQFAMSTAANAAGLAAEYYEKGRDEWYTAASLKIIEIIGMK